MENIKKLLYVALAVIILSTIILLILKLIPEKPQTAPVVARQIELPQPTNTVQEPTIASLPVTVLPAPEEPAGQRNVKTFAMQFAERYGSYSTQTNFQNLKDTLPVMTEPFRATNQAIISKGSSADVPFYGVTTRSMATQVKENGDVQKKLLVTTQREETRGTGTPSRTIQQDLLLTLVQIAGNWFVDNAIWQPVLP